MEPVSQLLKRNAVLTFAEPHSTGGIAFVRIPSILAVEHQKKVGEKQEVYYESDETALEDFIALHWCVVAVQ